MKRIIAFLLCLVLTASLLGCGKEQEYVPTGGALIIDGETVPPTEADDDSANQRLELAYYPADSLNPYKASNYANRVLFSLLYQGLFAVNRSYQPVPMLCKSYTMTEDMRTYTFYLEEATFSDGVKLTVEDVYASLETAMKSQVYGGRFTHVAAMNITESGALSFRLDTAMENFPILLDVPVVKAADVSAERPIGTGPYYYENAANGLRLRKRGDWWCTSDLLVTANVIPLQEVTSVLTQRDAFEFSNVGVACADPCSDAYVDYRCDYELWEVDNGTMLYLGCNMQSKVFGKEKIRAALTYAIDRETIANTYYRGFGQAATLAASPSSPYYNKQLADRYAYNLEKFSQVISDEYMLGATVRFVVNKEDSLRVRVAREIAQTLRDCGLVVELVELSTRGYMETLNYNMFDLYLGQTRLSPNMDLTPFFRYYGKLQYGGMPDNNIYALCLQALANSGNYYNMLETVADDGRLCPILFHSYSVHATRGLLTGLNPARDNIFSYSIGKTIADVYRELSEETDQTS